MPREMDEANCAELLQEVREGSGVGESEAASGGRRCKGTSWTGRFPLLSLQENISEEDVDEDFRHLFEIVAGEVRG